ncbi:MAG: saccharopine dehydrogenase family protein [Dermatophilaceae bacterium]
MLLVYGATGYTGRVVVRALVDGGLQPVLAGRRREAVGAVADPLGLDVRAGAVTDLDLAGVTVVLNCAGPFSATAAPLARRCVDAGAHYLDLAGEVEEHRALAGLDAAARRAGVLVLPGVGYGIVPSDCLAAHVARRVGEPRSVRVALKTVGGVSRGTAGVVLGSLRRPGVQRSGGNLVPRSAGTARMQVDFGDGDGPTTVVTNPWRADLVASVPGASDYETFMAFPAPVRALMRIPHGGLLRWVAGRLPEGPSDDALARGRSAVWASATGVDGSTATAVVRGPDAYPLSGATALACARRVLAGDTTPGFHTPASAWGPDLVLDVPGLVREDV